MPLAGTLKVVDVDELKVDVMAPEVAAVRDVATHVPPAVIT